jgi:glycosyltransferase involved in cell wall biosynthesis
VDHLKRERPAVVFTALPAANVLAAAAARLAGGGVQVVTSHHSPAQTYNPVLNFADSVAGSLKSVKTIVSVSDAVKASQDGKPAAYLRKRRTIHNALPPAIEHHLATLAGQRDRSKARGRKVVATGRLASQKNYPVLIRAAQHMPDVEIEIVGAGPDEAALKALASELGVDKRVKFAGFMARSEALERLADGDVFTQPSLFEGHSLALVEAAKIGLPLVVSNVPVQIEGITTRGGERCGVAVDPHDDRALAAEITRLLDQPEAYRELAARSAQLARDATFEVMLGAYEGLVD